MTLAMASGISGCISLPEPAALVGPDITLLKAGETTLSDARLLMGPSMSVSAIADGTTLHQWMFDIARYGSPRAVHIAISFDRKGVMQQVDHISEIPY